MVSSGVGTIRRAKFAGGTSPAVKTKTKPTRGVDEARYALASVLTCFKSFAFCSTSSDVLPKKPASSSNDNPRLSALSRKNRSELIQGDWICSESEGALFLAREDGLPRPLIAKAPCPRKWGYPPNLGFTTSLQAIACGGRWSGSMQRCCLAFALAQSAIRPRQSDFETLTAASAKRLFTFESFR